MILGQAGQRLSLDEVAVPEPRPGQLLLRVRACGICRTDLHIVDGELTRPKLPLVPGHQIVGETEDGRRLGVPWLGWTCGECRYCRSGRENLCDRARFTGYDLDGGYAEWAVADERFCFPVPDGFAYLRSVANLTRRDGEEFLALAPRVPVRTRVEAFPLDQANEALDKLRRGDVRGA